MTETALGADVTPATAPAWRTFSGRRVTIHALEGSYAARRAPAELHQAERAAEALEGLAAPAGAARQMVHLILLEPVAAPPSASANGANAAPAPAHAAPDAPPADSVRRVLQPDAPAELVALPLARLLLAHWYGDALADVAPLRDGIAGLAAARSGTGRSVAEATAWVRAEMAAHRPVSLFAPPGAAPAANAAPPGAVFSASAPEGLLGGAPRRAAPPPERAAPAPTAPVPQHDEPDHPAATAFVSYLASLAGAEAFKRFLGAYDPRRRDQAATAVYQQPLAALEAAWLGGLSRPDMSGQTLRALARRLGPLLRPYWLQQAEIVVYAIFVAAYSQVLPFASRYLINEITSYFQHGRPIPPAIYAPHLLVRFTIFLFGIYLLNALVAMRQAYVTNWINQRVRTSLQEQMFAHLQRLSHNFYATAKVGDLMARLSNDLMAIQQAMTQVTNMGLSQTLIALSAAGTILYQTTRAHVPLMGVLILCIIPLFAFSFFALQSRFTEASREQQRRIGDVTNTVQENLSAQAVVKAFGLEERAEATYHVRLMAQLRAALRLAVLGTLSTLSMQMTMALGQLIVLCVGSYYVLNNPRGLEHTGMNIGTLVMLTQLLPLLLGPVAGLSGVGQSVQMASGALDRVTELSETPVAIADKPGAAVLPPLAREIQLEHVTFGYGGDRPILQDLDLMIPAGANVAFVGPSGCGKSTTINLLLRFYDPEGGRVLFDGQDLKDVTLASLRGQIGLVFQDTFIFDTTLRENIALAKPGATDEEIAAAARDAQLDEYIKTLPDGYDTLLGERGARMSGGQRQRLAIARVMLRQPRVLILDEATSALDAHTEAELLETLSRLAQGRTTISITHRLAWAALTDYIYVLNAGRLIEQGKHTDMVRAGGLYQQLWEEQTGGGPGSGMPGTEAARLQAVPLFASLPGDALAALAQKLTRAHFEAGQDMVHQGDPGDTLYVLDRGEADVLVAGGRNGGRRVNTLRGGDFFGEIALLSGGPRTATVRATQPTDVFRLSQADFGALLAQQPALRQSVNATMSARLSALTAPPSPAPAP